MTLHEMKPSCDNTADGTAAALIVNAQRLAEEDVVYRLMEVVLMGSLAWIAAKLL